MSLLSLLISLMLAKKIKKNITVPKLLMVVYL